MYEELLVPSQMKVGDLRHELESRGRDASGLKKELVARLERILTLEEGNKKSQEAKEGRDSPRPGGPGGGRRQRRAAGRRPGPPPATRARVSARSGPRARPSAPPFRRGARREVARPPEPRGVPARQPSRARVARRRDARRPRPATPLR